MLPNTPCDFLLVFFFLKISKTILMKSPKKPKQKQVLLKSKPKKPRTSLRKSVLKEEPKIEDLDMVKNELRRSCLEGGAWGRRSEEGLELGIGAVKREVCKSSFLLQFFILFIMKMGSWKIHINTLLCAV